MPQLSWFRGFPQLPRLAFAVLITLAALFTQPLSAQAKDLPSPNTGERLSSYLIRHGLDRTTYLEGLCWSTDNSRAAQAKRIQRLQMAFSSVPNELSVWTSEQTSEPLRSNWQKFLNALQPNGCAKLAYRDPQFLALVPSQDPVLHSQDQISIAMRPLTVGVLRTDLRYCMVRHQPGLSAAAYLAACDADQTDAAYIFQPGATEATEVGLGLWNQTQQPAPAPGALVLPMSVLKNMPRWFEEDLREVLLARATDAQFKHGHTATPTQPSKAQRTPALASDSQDLALTASDWGGIGLLQTPTARLPQAGYGAIHLSKTAPYTRLNFTLAPFDWLEAGFRYVDVANRLYGATIAGSQSYKDKSIDAKFRLWEESRYLPQVAVGFRDLVGTGLFSGEYLAASKRFGKLDASLGMGWGYVGGRQDIDNPLGGLYSKYKTRPTSTESATSGGKFNLSTYFRGPAALFGGVQYQMDGGRWILKAEVDGNNYQNEPQSNDQSQSSPINIGVVYRFNKWLDLTAGLERGNQATFGVTLYTDLSSLSTPKISDPKPMAVMPTLPSYTRVDAPSQTYSDLKRALERQVNWSVGQVVLRGKQLRIKVLEHDVYNWQKAVDQANAVTHQFAPADVREFAYELNVRGMPIQTVVVDRQDWVREQTQLARPREQFNQPAVAHSSSWVEPVRDSLTDQPVLASAPRGLTGGLGFTYKQSFGGPDGFILAQLSAQAEAEFRFTPSSWLYGSVELGLLDNYDKFDYTAPSNLPRVRTYVREYVTSSDVTLPVLQATTSGKLSDQVYWQAYGGLLESMYAGTGAEVLYRPRGASFALGLDVNRVRQRGFEQDFSMRSYQVNTGHATLYWNTGWQDIVAKLSVGQYLAADRGGTVDLARQFANGVRIGAFMTRTNVSAAQFGEGSFDKGIYVSIPFDVMMTRSSSSIADLIWRPLTRDGGAKLNRGFELFDLTSLGR
jgi:hypothetical protein